jgi:predicted PurR-regulated permease PerM/CheY-like chemotaxis protein
MAVLAALYFGRDVLIPFALAVLVSFLLAPPVTWLEKLRLGRVVSVVVVLAIAYSIAGALLWVGAEQFSSILTKLPEYQWNIEAKVQRIENAADGSSRFSRAAASVKAIATELTPGSTDYEKRRDLGKSGTSRSTKQQPEKPVPVEVVKHDQGIAGSLGMISSSLAYVVGTLAAVVVLSLFMLLRRSDLRDRIFRLFGRGRINVVTTAMDDAAKRVSRYLLTQLCVNCSYGLMLGLGLYFIGVPYSVFWGALAAVLRFVPYVGTLIAAACPFLLSLAVFDGWRRPLLTLALWAVVEALISGALEPWLYAARAGISSLAVLLSAAFWTTLWGPIGLIVATPLTVCLVVLGRHVPQLEFLYILFGDEPALAPEASYYQRLLSLDEDGAREVLDNYLKEKPLLDLYDQVLIPALSLVEEDQHEGALDDKQQKFIYQTTRDLIEDLGEEFATAESYTSRETEAPRAPVMIVPARDEADELVGLMLAQILRYSGYESKAVPVGFLREMLTEVTKEKPGFLFISAVPPFALSHARSICRRARQRVPDVKPIICFWGSKDGTEEIRGRLGAGCSDYLVNSLSEAELQLRLLNPQQESEAAQAKRQEQTAPEHEEVEAGR